MHRYLIFEKYDQMINSIWDLFFQSLVDLHANPVEHSLKQVVCTKNTKKKKKWRDEVFKKLGLQNILIWNGTDQLSLLDNIFDSSYIKTTNFQRLEKNKSFFDKCWKNEKIEFQRNDNSFVMTTLVQR